MQKKSRKAERSRVAKVDVYASVVTVCTRGGPFAGIATGTVKARAHKMLAELKLHRAELSVALVNDAAIHELNRDYRSKNKPTDVLAFAMEEGEPSPQNPGLRLLGDVIISVDTARRQAKARRRSLLAEVTMLLAHGLLHLLGFDHQTDAEEREMLAKTRVLEQAAEARRSA
ncbi:MAG: rRNA maturation RNase YbeY [Polyangiaceae bacterium]|nr:rRNA maturation RNase YbeY [Polyangiaceae bacterium]